MKRYVLLVYRSYVSSLAIHAARMRYQQSITQTSINAFFPFSGTINGEAGAVSGGLQYLHSNNKDISQEISSSSTSVFHGTTAHPVLIYLTNYLAELALVECSFLEFLPSVIAAAAVFLGQRNLDQSTHPWNHTLQHYTGYKSRDLQVNTKMPSESNSIPVLAG